MMSQVITLFVIFTVFVSISTGEQNCDLLGRHFYEYLNCIPNYKSGDLCPVSYDCSNYKLSTDYCTFKNVTYKFGEQLRNTSYCNFSCFCDERKGGINPITCAAVGCPRPKPEKSNDCYETNKLAGCCPTGDKICPPFDDVAKCELNGKTYMEDQEMDTGNTCWKCICKKGFKGIIEEPYCIKDPCDTEIHYSKQIAAKCAPVYSKEESEKALCCSYSFLCPDNIKDFKIIDKENPTARTERCTFMDHEFRINDQFFATYEHFSLKNVTCSCILPPYVSCIEHEIPRISELHISNIE